MGKTYTKEFRKQLRKKNPTWFKRERVIEQLETYEQTRMELNVDQKASQEDNRSSI